MSHLRLQRQWEEALSNAKKLLLITNEIIARDRIIRITFVGITPSVVSERAGSAVYAYAFFFVRPLIVYSSKLGGASMAVPFAFLTNDSLMMFTVNPWLFFKFVIVSLRRPRAPWLHANEMIDK
ncbi:hypothetical protein BDR03DRAFT_986224 [Suillus americanus]|nr:hypothetical protein BDR03DRAFT_986224 [Suillus americanus]